jgi:hypothetical protein
LAASPELAELPAHQLVTLYARRMQIELSFRDLKSHRYGQGFEDSLTRKGPRIAVLLLLNTLAAFACWLAPFRTTRRLYSVMRLGREALVRCWRNARIQELLDQLRQPPLPPIASRVVPA